MRKKIQTLAVVAVLLAVILAARFTLADYVEKEAKRTIPVYDETYLCIDFRDIVIEETEAGLNMTPKEGLSTTKLENIEKDIEKLEVLMEEFPDVEENLFGNISSDKKLAVVSFTKVSLEENNQFLLYTSIYRGKEEEDGEYLYTVTTNGSWSANSIIGGADYPAAGDDYVTQTYPEEFVIISDSFRAKYGNEPLEGISGEDYWRTDGDSFFIKYGIVDDPFGYRQNQSFTLTTKSVALQSEEGRQIVSCYVHSWDSEFVDVSFENDTSKSAPNCWKVYNYVPFAF